MANPFSGLGKRLLSRKNKLSWYLSWNVAFNFLTSNFQIGVSPCTEKIPDKSGMLAERSPVFRAMLEGPLAENRDRIIVIKDVDPRAFEILIRSELHDFSI